MKSCANPRAPMPVSLVFWRILDTVRYSALIGAFPTSPRGSLYPGAN